MPRSRSSGVELEGNRVDFMGTRFAEVVEEEEG